MSFRFERNRLRKGAEDSQPNEAIDKRRKMPSVVVPSKQPRSDSQRGSRGRGRGRGWGRGGPPTAGHAVHRPPPHNLVPPPSAQGSGLTNSESKRVPARILDASKRQSIPRGSSEAVVVRPNPYYQQSARVSSESELARTTPASTSLSPMPTSNGPDSDIYPRNAPPATKAQTPPTPASHNSVSAVQTIAQTAISRVPHSPPPLKRRRIETAVKVKLEEVPSVLPPRAANSPPPIRIEPERRAPSPPPADQEPPSILPPRARNPPSIRIKQERRTPSPSPEAPPRLSATSGSKRYWPVPNNCKRAVDPQFHENRQAWLRRECAVLKDLGLKVVKYFFRDDGMVIEWQTRNSDQPVWLDTLRPVQQRPRLPVPAGQEIIDLDHDEEPPPPTPIAVMQDAVPAGREIIDIDADSEVEPLSPRPSSPAPIAEEDLQQLSLDFIRRYICTFDHNRDALLSAYSEDAFFSFRDNNFARLTHFTIQPKGPSVSQSKPGTMPKLLPKNYRFSPRNGELHIDYDTVVFEPDSDSPNNIPNKVLLSVHGQLIGRLDERARMAIDQTFLLKRNVGVGVGAGGGTGGASARASEVWPLVVISHQMVVRDTPWVRWTGNLEDLTA